MCFKSSKPPAPKEPPPPPTERDANMDALQKRQQSSLAASQSGFPSTVKFGASGADTTNKTQPKLGM